MLGQETLLEAIAKDFCVKIFVDKDRLSNYYADLEVIAPEFLTTDKESTRFEVINFSSVHFSLGGNNPSRRVMTISNTDLLDG